MNNSIIEFLFKKMKSVADNHSGYGEGMATNGARVGIEIDPYGGKYIAYAARSDNSRITYEDEGPESACYGLIDILKEPKKWRERFLLFTRRQDKGKTP